MGDYCIYDSFEQCFHDCDECPIVIWDDDFEPEYDPYDKYDREEIIERNY